MIEHQQKHVIMNDMITKSLLTEADTISFGRKLADCLYSPLVLGFSGHIGAGKTTLIRAMLQSLGVKSAIKSPTFSLVESYQIGIYTIHHFDLYRIHDADELEHIGMRDYLTDDKICLIEWPEHGNELVNHLDAMISLTTKGEGRVLVVKAIRPAGQQLLIHLEPSL